jgi:hypothetical protein
LQAGWDVGSVVSYWFQRLLATDGYITGLVESKGWPDPILEVQWAAATGGCAPEDKGALVSGTAEFEVAAVPVPMVAVQ